MYIRIKEVKSLVIEKVENNDESMLKEGYMLLVQYPNNKFFRTTKITKVKTINNNLVVTTKNSIYEFEEVKGE